MSSSSPPQPQNEFEKPLTVLNCLTVIAETPPKSVLYGSLENLFIIIFFFNNASRKFKFSFLHNFNFGFFLNFKLFFLLQPWLRNLEISCKFQILKKISLNKGITEVLGLNRTQYGSKGLLENPKELIWARLGLKWFKANKNSHKKLLSNSREMKLHGFKRNSK